MKKFKTVHDQFRKEDAEECQVNARFRNSEKEKKGKTFAEKHTSKSKSRGFCKWF